MPRMRIRMGNDSHIERPHWRRCTIKMRIRMGKERKLLTDLVAALGQEAAAAAISQRAILKRVSKETTLSLMGRLDGDVGLDIGLRAVDGRCPAVTTDEGEDEGENEDE